MLNKPKFLSPSINMYDNSVIDLNSATLPFSCIVDGNESITGFQIVVRKLKDDIKVFDTGMKPLSKPFFPINNRNQNVVFSINLKDYFATASTNSGFVNSADAYYWTVTFRNNNSGTEVQSTAEVFYANSTPKTTIYYSYNDDFSNLSVVSNSSRLTKRKIYFKSTYTQSEKVSLKRYGWRLTDTTNNVVIMDTISQNQIYGIADDISCVCNGLINQTDYQLELYIETQNGYSNILQSINFNVDYAVKSMDADFEVEALNNTSGIMLSWKKIKTTEGFVEGGTVSYNENFPLQSSNSVEIPGGTNVIFSKTSNNKDLSIDENSYIALSFWFDKTQDTKLFEISGVDDQLRDISRKLEYAAANRKLKYTIKNGNTTAICEKQISPTVSELCWYVVTLYPLLNGVADYKLVESISEGCLFPDEELYPEEQLYPDFGEWNKLRDEVN